MLTLTSLAKVVFVGLLYCKGPPFQTVLFGKEFLPGGGFALESEGDASLLQSRRRRG